MELADPNQLLGLDDFSLSSGWCEDNAASCNFDEGTCLWSKGSSSISWFSTSANVSSGPGDNPFVAGNSRFYYAATPMKLRQVDGIFVLFK